MLDLFTPIALFTRRHPAFLYGFASFIGASAAISSFSPLLITAFVLLFGLLTLHAIVHHESLRRLLLALLLATVTFTLAQTRYDFPSTLPQGKGTALIELNAVTISKTPFGKFWNYQATLLSFTQNDKVAARNLPVRLSIPYSPIKQRPLAGYTYQINATLKQSSKGGYYLSPDPNATWIPGNRLFSIAEWRFGAKTSLRESIQHAINDPHTAAFLSGMMTGTFDDQVLAFELGRFGLQHLMAISGLHFTILAGIIGFFCALIFSKKAAAGAGAAMMTAYFLFLGGSPSVLRAWITILVGLTAFFFEKRSSGLNAIGLSLLAVSLWNPMMLSQIGFQFSFGVTAAILLWNAPCESLLRSVFPKRGLNEAATMDAYDRHGYCLLFFLRNGLALALAVNLVAFPLTLYYFQNFPVVSLVYNLFFPFMVSISLFLLTCALAISLILPFAAAWIHALNEAYTGFLLNFAFNLPRGFDITLQSGPMPTDLLLLYLLGILLAGMYFQSKEEPFLPV